MKEHLNDVNIFISNDSRAFDSQVLPQYPTVRISEYLCQYRAKVHVFCELIKAASRPFRLEELITFDVIRFHLMTTLLTKKLCLSSIDQPGE